jgi:hypothetical protein
MRPGQSTKKGSRLQIPLFSQCTIETKPDQLETTPELIPFKAPAADCRLLTH